MRIQAIYLPFAHRLVLLIATGIAAIGIAAFVPHWHLRQQAIQLYQSEHFRPLDWWNHDVGIIVRDREITLESVGRDGHIHTADDISVTVEF